MLFFYLHNHTLSPDIRVHRAGSQLKNLEASGIDPDNSRMLSERSTIWATPRQGFKLFLVPVQSPRNVPYL